MNQPKKLIEVALPLDAINAAAAREKSIRHGHPSTLHLWWARRPLAAARAVLFAQLVDDPSARPDLYRTEQDQAKERQRLFRLLEELVKWENTTNEVVLQQARDAIWQSWRHACARHADHPRAAELFRRDQLPAFHDPFAGGGAIPLEAQRLGLTAYASDLNPVAVLINKAMIEIPPRFAGRPPVHPAGPQIAGSGDWTGAQGLAADVRHYGQWMRDQAAARIGWLYPAVTDQDGQPRTVIAWLWARTVPSPNPAYAGVPVPLVSTFLLSTKPGKEAWVEPVVEGRDYRFEIHDGTPPAEAKTGTKLGRGANFRCLLSGTTITPEYIKAEGMAGRMGARLLAIVAEGDRQRIYLPPTPEHEALAAQAQPAWQPEGALPDDPRNFWTVQYGLATWGDLFTPRQLVALTTFADLVGEAREAVRRDALAAGLPDDGRPLRDGGAGATAYAEAVGVYLACALDRGAMFWSGLCYWLNQPKNEIVANTFGRQALAMTWDFAEANPFCGSGGGFAKQVGYLAEGVGAGLTCRAAGSAEQRDAAQAGVLAERVISSDPPYYDNISYADLSDFFHVWLRRSQQAVFPELFATLAVPKAAELIASPYRHGGKQQAEAFFLDGMTQAIHNLAEQTHPAFPVTIYYAFKQAESDDAAGTASTGWETFLDAVMRAGFAITGTWPMRTERPTALKSASNVLATSVVLVCRRRGEGAVGATRRELVAALRAELPGALRLLQSGNIAPVDLAQAAIGPGMGVFSRYREVLDAEGRPVTVREALALINEILDEVLAEQEGDFDADTRWALAWFDQQGFGAGEYGLAETLSKAKNTSVAGMVEAGILHSEKGHVRLLAPAELPADWDPAKDRRLTVWEMVHQLVRVHDGGGGEEATAKLLAALGGRAETARELAYRLYTICERRRRAAEAQRYNALVQSWPAIADLARDYRPTAQQGTLELE